MQVKHFARDRPPFFTDRLYLGNQHGSLVGSSCLILAHKLLKSVHEGSFVDELKEVYFVSLGSLSCLTSALFTIARAS
jgi:hypothetical protein